MPRFLTFRAKQTIELNFKQPTEYLFNNTSKFNGLMLKIRNIGWPPGRPCRYPETLNLENSMPENTGDIQEYSQVNIVRTCNT